MQLSEFSHAERISEFPRTIIFNKCEQNNMIGKILNASDNVDGQEDLGLQGHIPNFLLQIYMNIQTKTEYATRKFETQEKYREQ